MYKSQKNHVTGRLSSNMILVSLIVLLLYATYIFCLRNVTKVEIPNFTTHTFEELNKTNEFIGIDIFYNNNKTSLKDAYVMMFDLNFKDKEFGYLDYTYLFFDNKNLFEQKIDITKDGELLFSRKEKFRLQTNYKQLPTLHQVKNMLFALERSDWLDYFNVSDGDDVEFRYIGVKVKNEKPIRSSNVYVINEHKIVKKDSDWHLAYNQNNYLWLVRINNDINYVYIFIEPNIE